MGSPLDQLVADREAAQAQRILDRQFQEAEQRSSIERSTDLARSRLDRFAEHGAIGHTQSALWHAGALAAHGTAGTIQTLGNVAGVTASVVDTSMNVLTGLPHPITQSMAIMNRLAGAAMGGTGTVLSGGGQVLSAAESTANRGGQVLSAAGSAAGSAASTAGSATGQALGAMRSAASSSARWEQRAPGIYDRVVDPVMRRVPGIYERVVDPIIRTAVETAM